MKRRENSTSTATQGRSVGRRNATCGGQRKSTSIALGVRGTRAARMLQVALLMLSRRILGIDLAVTRASAAPL